jgi:RES domain-containing protein
VNTPDPSTHQHDLDEALAATFPASDPPAMTSKAIATTPDSQDGTGKGQEVAVVEVFRVVHRDQAGQPFSSSSNRSAGRWTSEGIPAVYASTSPAGAVLEFLAHLDGEKPVDLVLVKARMPGHNVTPATSLPENWRDTPHREDVRAYGNAWISSRKGLALDLPSVLCEQSRNLLINPEHENISQLLVESAEPFTLDPRLFRK